MSLDYINEAFKRLELLNEDTFDTSLEGMNKLSDFLNEPEQEVVKVIDPEASTQDELQDSYVGKVIINCDICHSHVFQNKEDIEIDENGIVNIEMQCPYCGEQEGFTIIGEIKPYEAETEPQDPKVTVDGEDVPVSTSAEIEDELSESLLESIVTEDSDAIKGLINTLENSCKGCYMIKPYTNFRGDKPYGIRIVSDTRNEDVLTTIRDYLDITLEEEQDMFYDGDVKWDGPAEKDILVRFNLFKKKSVTESVVNEKDYKPHTKRLLALLRSAEIVEEDPTTVNESMNNVNVETDDTILTLNTDDSGKVTVSSEPKQAEIVEGEEMIAPVEAETQAEIETNNELDSDTSVENEIQEVSTDDEFVEFDVEEVDEEGIDDMTESYLKRVYENVDSFKTHAVSSSDSTLVVEGVIKFKSGVEKKTGFIFEAVDATSDGKVRFAGMNEHLSRGKKSFSLTGKIVDKKFLAEKLTYNYRAKTAEGSSNRIYGTITRNK